MSRRLIVRPEADITAAALWYENRDAGLGLELTLRFARRSGARWKTRLSTCGCVVTLKCDGFSLAPGFSPVFRAHGDSAALAA